MNFMMAQARKKLAVANLEEDWSQASEAMQLASAEASAEAAKQQKQKKRHQQKQPKMQQKKKPPVHAAGVVARRVADFGGSERELHALNALDELMCKELEEAGKPALPAYGRGWFEQRCLPGRSSYLNWHTLTMEDAGPPGGAPAGFIMLARQTMAAAGGGRKRKRRREAYVELFWISLRPERRGGGGGSELLVTGLRRAHELWDDVTSCRLHVMSNNAAVRFYKRHGFEVSATKQDYPPGYETLRMVKALS